MEDASSALSSAVLATMTGAVRDCVAARRTREATGANALADANAHTRTAVRARRDEAMLRASLGSIIRDLGKVEVWWMRSLINEEDPSKNRAGGAHVLCCALAHSVLGFYK